MIRVSDLYLPLGYSPADERKTLAKLLKCGENAFTYTLARRSLDCRGNIRWVCAYDISSSADERKLAQNARKSGAKCFYPYEPKRYVFPARAGNPVKRPVVVGFGPAGMFCALMLAENGFAPIVVERGETIEDRARTAERFINTGVLDENSNIQFGEGGAGAFSDGKLTTLIKDKDSRCCYILKRFAGFGAPEDILYSAHPHIGTDLLRGVITNIRKAVVSAGGTFMFSTAVTSLVIQDGALCGVRLSNGETLDTDTVFLCIGHSARDTFRSLHASGLVMERKPFSVGVRIEHLQPVINKARYRGFASEKTLPPAEYKAVSHTPSGRALYTFCMCPGGYVSAAASERGGVVTNGMSLRARDGDNANSALLVSVEPSDLPDSSLFAGVEFQRNLEKAAFELGGGEYKAPAQTYADFAQGVPTRVFGNVIPTYPRGVTGCCLKDILPPFVRLALAQGIPMIDKLIPGFASPDSVLTAVESRSTCPLRIVRDPVTMQANISGVYPVGEGAGYAGGIMSAAADGIKAAETYATKKGNAICSK